MSADEHGARHSCRFTTALQKDFNYPLPSDRDFVAKEFGAIEASKQTLERLGEHLAKTAA